MLNRRSLLLALALAATSVVTGCDGGSPLVSPAEARELRLARSTWEGSAARSGYRFEARRACFCPREFSQWHTIDVRNGVVTAVRLEDGTLLAPQFFESVYTVEQLFELLERESSRARSPELRSVEMSFDRTYGYPTYLSFGYDERLLDAGLSVYTRNLVPLP